MKKGLLIFLGVLLATPALPQQNGSETNDTMTAGALYTGCLAASAVGADDKLCNPYFRGLTDGLFVMQLMAQSNRSTCMPTDTGISVDDARRIFNRYMATHSDAAQHSAGLMAALAIFDAYPCK